MVSSYHRAWDRVYASRGRVWGGGVKDLPQLPAGSRVLELGCGTGRILLPLAQAGVRMVGLDNDLDMLDYLRSHLPAELTPEPLLFAAEITNFHLELSFGLVILPCNTWSTLSAAQRLQALGWRVLRYWNDDVLLRTDAVLEDVLRALGES